MQVFQVVSDPVANIRVELDYAQKAVWVLKGGVKQPLDEVKFGMQYVNGAWNPTQGALLSADSLDEINGVMAWLQEHYPTGL